MRHLITEAKASRRLLAGVSGDVFPHDGGYGKRREIETYWRNQENNIY
jgi:hypothetical protein